MGEQKQCCDVKNRFRGSSDERVSMDNNNVCNNTDGKSQSPERTKLDIIIGGDTSPVHVNLNNEQSAGLVPNRSVIGLSPAHSDYYLNEDPWALPELQDNSIPWSDLDTKSRIQRVVITVLKFAGLFLLLYIFVCSLDFLSSAFRLLGGKAAGEVFQNNEHLQNPVVGLMIGVLATVLVQSSSTSSSIVVTMVASEFLTVSTAIPIIMGANIGTSVTNTIVSLAQSTDRNEFRRAFGGATVHDMFNWLTVIILLPIEISTRYLFYLTESIVDSFEWHSGGANKEFLTVLTKPFTSLIIQLDKSVIEGIASGDPVYNNRSLIKQWCGKSNKLHSASLAHGTPLTLEPSDSNSFRPTGRPYREPCRFLLRDTGLNDSLVGVILLVISLFLLCSCLVCMVKILHSMLKGRMAGIIKKTMNSDFPGHFAFLTGYFAMLVGCCLTILVQSSSIFTSALTPLVGIGVITLERVYPLTLGSNIGTTTTGLLASLTATGPRLRSSVQIALCHLFFNLSGILLFYPLPFMRFPIRLAKMLGNITARYRWFALLYVAMMFFILPAFVFVLSMGGPFVMALIGVPLLAILFLVLLINLLQRKRPGMLPQITRNWEFLPLWMHSLDPADRVIARVRGECGRFCPLCCKTPDERRNNLSDMYNKSFTSRTAIYKNSSMHTIPSSGNVMGGNNAALSATNRHVTYTTAV